MCIAVGKVSFHVGLRARAGLEHDQWELAVEVAVDHLLRRLGNEIDLIVR